MFTEVTIIVDGAFTFWLSVDNFTQALIALEWTYLTCASQATQCFSSLAVGRFH